MKLTEIYALSDHYLIDKTLKIIKLPTILALSNGLLVQEPPAQAIAYITAEALDWLENHQEFLELTFTKSRPQDRRYLLTMASNVAFGQTRLQAVLRGVLIFSEGKNDR